MAEELKACPFCGSSATVYSDTPCTVITLTVRNGTLSRAMIAV